MAGLQNIPERAVRGGGASTAPASGGRSAGSPCPSLRPVNQVLVLVLFLWTFNDFNTPYVLFGESAPEAGRPDLDPHLPGSFVTWNFGTGSAMSVLLLLFLLVVTAVYLLVTSRGRRSRCREARRVAAWRPPRVVRLDPADRPHPAHRFVLLPVYVMVSQLAEAAARTCRATFHWLPSRADAPAVRRHLAHRAAGAGTS